MAAADNRATWEQLLQVNQGPTGPTGPQGPAGVSGATGATGPRGSGLTPAPTQNADFSAVIWTYYPVDVSGGNVNATLPDLTTMAGGEEIALVIVGGGGNQLTLLAFGGGQQVIVRADIGAGVAISPAILTWGVTLIADPDNSSWVAISVV